MSAARSEPATVEAVLWDWRGRRLEQARARVEAGYPKVCPACGAPGPVPTFLAPDEFECASAECLATFTLEA